MVQILLSINEQFNIKINMKAYREVCYDKFLHDDLLRLVLMFLFPISQSPFHRFFPGI